MPYIPVMCSNCIYGVKGRWSPSAKAFTYFCHRHPPQIVAHDDFDANVALFPEVRPGGWCGDGITKTKKEWG